MPITRPKIYKHCAFAVLRINLSQVLPHSAGTSTGPGNSASAASAALSPKAVMEAMNAKAWPRQLNC